MDPTNLRAYDRPEVAQHYADLDYLSACERLLFDRYLKRGMAILDLGVGGGRTTPYLAQIATHYVGVDYAAEMIRVCRSKFPDLEFIQRDAADLSCFAASSFDAVVMAFNGLDYLSEEARERCLRECYRILRQQGVFVFSSHNPRAILGRPVWSKERVHELAKKVAGGNRFVGGLLFAVLSGAAALKAFLLAGWGSLARVARRIPTSAFWRGEGYFVDPSHGGLVTYCRIPARTIVEVERVGFHFLQVQGDDYARTDCQYVTDWYYYVFSKSDSPAKGETCE
jgi:SAM-dependent methyltransferase